MTDADFPVILGFGSMLDLSARDEAPPRLLGMRSVSDAGAHGLHRSIKMTQRPAGFVQGRTMARK